MTTTRIYFIRVGSTQTSILVTPIIQVLQNSKTHPMWFYYQHFRSFPLWSNGRRNHRRQSSKMAYALLVRTKLLTTFCNPLNLTLPLNKMCSTLKCHINFWRFRRFSIILWRKRRNGEFSGSARSNLYIVHS